jgi:hypothetical protein
LDEPARVSDDADWRRLQPLAPHGPAQSHAFAEVAWLSEPDARRLVGAIEQLQPEIARWAAGPDFGRLADRLWREAVRAPVDDLVGVGRELALDLAADLLALGDVLSGGGRYATAFALEGIAGALIEALVATDKPRIAGGAEPEARGDASRRHRRHGLL